MRKRYCVVVLFGLVLANTLSLFAQNNTARLTGTITDSTGGAIVAAEISVTNTETGIKRDTSSNDSGIYQVPLLQPGTYRVESIGQNRTERLISLVMLGDVVSVYLAVLRDVDPTPVPTLERLKSALARG